FSVYAWQRIWDLTDIARDTSEIDWIKVASADVPAIQGLYHQIVPPLLHPIEPQPSKAAGWMCNEGAKCYITATNGLHGIMLVPLIHPEATEVSMKISALMRQLPDHRNRPVYLCVRSYQAWLEPVLEDLGAKAAARQAVMVKHLTHLVKDEQVVRAAQPAQ